MTEAIEAAALAVATLNALAAALGGWLWRTGGGEGPRARAFWLALRVAQGSSLTLALLVGSLAAAGKHPREGLFYLYALLPLAVAFVAEQVRVAVAQSVLDELGLRRARDVGRLPREQQLALVGEIMRRELGVMALSALVVMGLALRAATTAHGF